MRFPPAVALPTILVLAWLAATARAQDRPVSAAASVEGLWITAEGDGVFEIGACGARLCGRLVGMRYDGAMPLDVWKRPQCRQQLLTGFRPADGDGRWTGSILDPDNGHAYDATIWSPRPGVLKLRGYVLLSLFGETRTWSRYAGPIGMACKLPG